MIILILLLCNISANEIKNPNINIKENIIINEKNNKIFIVGSFLGFGFIIETVLLLTIFGEKKYAKNKFNKIKILKSEEYVNELNEIKDLTIEKKINRMDSITELEKIINNIDKDYKKNFETNLLKIKKLTKELIKFIVNNQTDFNNTLKKIKERQNNSEIKISYKKIYDFYLLDNKKEILENKINLELYEIYKDLYIKNNKWYNFGYYDYIENINNSIVNIKSDLYTLYENKEVLIEESNYIKLVLNEIKSKDIIKDQLLINEINNIINSLLKKDLEEKLNEIESLQKNQKLALNENIDEKMNYLKYYIYIKLIENNSEILNTRYANKINIIKNELEILLNNK